MMTQQSQLSPPHLMHLHELIGYLNDLSADHKIVLAIDTFEELDQTERWFRDIFLKYLHIDILVLTAGRSSLKDEWVESWRWSEQILQRGIPFLTESETEHFLQKRGINNPSTIQDIWNFSNGHPLTLTLSALTFQDRTYPPSNLFQDEGFHKIVKRLTDRWLREIREPDLFRIVEVAAIFTRFNQEAIEYVVGEQLDYRLFQMLTNLSFIRWHKDGWFIHDLVRGAILADLKERDRIKFERLNRKVASYYYKRLISTRDLKDIAAFFYHSGDEFIQSVFFEGEENPGKNMYLEPLNEHNLVDLKDFFEHKKKQITVSEAEYYNRFSDKMYRFYASAEHNQRELEKVDIDYIKRMGFESTKLLRDQQGSIIGMSVIVPIHEDSLKKLSEEPVSRMYFKRLPREEYDYFNQPPNERAGYYIRLLDYKDPSDKNVRSYLMYSLFPLLLTGGKIVVSTPLSFLQQVLENFGFKVVPNSEHEDFGEEYPAPTYILDLTGKKLQGYLNNFIQDASKNNQMKYLSEIYGLTERELDIVRLILEDCSNREIAERLFVAEVTVKKHITRILRKTESANRTQLIRKLIKLM
ncbi:helix-turn-helix domain-containing protein [Halalkalibacillus sediminis]|nr:response regulator transcription factor [Halalkalibacillus sediminis]